MGPAKRPRLAWSERLANQNLFRCGLKETLLPPESTKPTVIGLDNAVARIADNQKLQRNAAILATRSPPKFCTLTAGKRNFGHRRI
ncbi:hypothetical protein TWF225_008926 [Orbilia oligospora]|nr:hypothetical protein TWF706_011219 [Orbilia oligospora]KAF3175421.1 hypothetical protein TWF225_008926 [Orbilia oligospora]KAF3252040.1 hypothetical protein TWF128_006872 [Orbilia oligospora]KAF3264753.1 hypothetical protein TWF217_002939 [Orbilia oligospora]KAF3281066.1 hypothetical protein TWF132_011375 [Orbilia oligospora]